MAWYMAFELLKVVDIPFVTAEARFGWKENIHYCHILPTKKLQTLECHISTVWIFTHYANEFWISTLLFGEELVC